MCFPTTDASWPSHTRNLMFVCKTLHEEVTAYLSKAPRAFELDIAIVNNHWIWPTWTYIPGMKIDDLIENLNINLICCCNEDERASPVTESSSWATSLAFIKVISHFLQSGTSTASFEGTGTETRSLNFRIKAITVNVDTALIRTGNRTLSEDDVPFRQVQGLGHLTFNPLYSADMNTYLETLERLLQFVLIATSRLDDGLTVRERVDCMGFTVDGKTKGAVSIAQVKSSMDKQRAEDRARELM